MEITRKAYAKINLGLDVIGKRDDGYHLVKMIMQNVDLFDTLDFEDNVEDVMCESETMTIVQRVDGKEHKFVSESDICNGTECFVVIRNILT